MYAKDVSDCLKPYILVIVVKIVVILIIEILK